MDQYRYRCNNAVSIVVVWRNSSFKKKISLFLISTCRLKNYNLLWTNTATNRREENMTTKFDRIVFKDVKKTKVDRKWKSGLFERWKEGKNRSKDA